MRDTIATVLVWGTPWSNGIRALTFLALFVILWRQPTETKLGKWTNALFLTTFLAAAQVSFLTIYLSERIRPADVDGPIEWFLVIGLNVLPVIASITGIGVAIYTIRVDKVLISHEGVFATLARALPVIVADNTGIIRHTTDALDDLVGAARRELIGQRLEVLMPERYITGHQHGMDRYLTTREPHIIGTVVRVDLLRRDGTELPVFLALNTADVDGQPWYVASLWGDQNVQRAEQDARGEEQEARGKAQDVRSEHQATVATAQAATGHTLSLRGADMDIRGEHQDERGRVLDEREKDHE